MKKIYTIQPSPKMNCLDEEIELNEYAYEYWQTFSNLNVNTAYFENNIKTNMMYLSDDYKTSGGYNIVKNEMYFVKADFEKAVTHELLHLSTRVEGLDRIYCGFLQSIKGEERVIGIGLNEGYTALLDYRYFSDFCNGAEEFKASAYSSLQSYISLLEEVVGEDIMMHFYFNAGLKGLYEYLSSFMGKRRTMDFIHYFDDLLFIDTNKTPTEEEIKRIPIIHNELMGYIIELKYNIAKYRCETKKISKRDFEREKKSFEKFNNIAVIVDEKEYAYDVNFEYLDDAYYDTKKITKKYNR